MDNSTHIFACQIVCSLGTAAAYKAVVVEVPEEGEEKCSFVGILVIAVRLVCTGRLAHTRNDMH